MYYKSIFYNGRIININDLMKEPKFKKVIKHLAIETGYKYAYYSAWELLRKLKKLQRLLSRKSEYLQAWNVLWDQSCGLGISFNTRNNALCTLFSNGLYTIRPLHKVPETSYWRRADCTLKHIERSILTKP